MSFKIRTGQTLETKYRYLRINAKILTRSLELAAERLTQVAGQLEPTGSPLIKREPFTASDLRELASEFTRTAHQCGIPERGR